MFPMILLGLWLITFQPIPLDLLTLVSFSESAVQRPVNANIRRSFWSGNNSDTNSISSRTQDREANESRVLFPFVIHHNGRLGMSGQYIIFAHSSSSRQEWKQKLEETKGLRKVVQESNKVFEVESLSVDTFLLPSASIGPNSTVWQDGTLFTGKVTCSVPFSKCIVGHFQHSEYSVPFVH